MSNKLGALGMGVPEMGAQLARFGHLNRFFPLLHPDMQNEARSFCLLLSDKKRAELIKGPSFTLCRWIKPVAVAPMSAIKYKRMVFIKNVGRF